MANFEQTERVFGLHRPEYASLVVSFIGGPVVRDALPLSAGLFIGNQALLTEAAQALAGTATGEQVEGGIN